MPDYHEALPLGLIRLTGPEAATFLHGQVTCEINGLPPGQAVHGAYCTPKGRALATFLVWRFEDVLYLRLPAELREAVQKRLSMYVLRAKVRLEDAGLDWAAAGVSGTGAADCVKRVFGAVPQTLREAVLTPAAMVIRLERDRYEIWLRRAGVQALHEQLAACATRSSTADWARSDVLSGVPVILPATQEQFVPQMINLDLLGGLSYTKGCYPGQEIVARTHYLGRLKQRAYRARLASGEPRPGDRLYSEQLGDQASGTVVNAVPAPDGSHDVLAVMQIAAAQTGCVRWGAPDGPLLELLPLPYEVTAAT